MNDSIACVVTALIYLICNHCCQEPPKEPGYAQGHNKRMYEYLKANEDMHTGCLIMYVGAY